MLAWIMSLVRDYAAWQRAMDKLSLQAEQDQAAQLGQSRGRK